MKKSVKLGEKVYSNITQEPWVIHSIDGNLVTLTRTNQEKTIKMATLAAYYITIGSTRDLKYREACKRHGWVIYQE